MKSLLFSVGCLLLISCSSDYSEELSGRYFYRDEGSEMKDILHHSSNRRGILSTILDYDYDNNFIIAVQQPHFEFHKSVIAFNLRDDLEKYHTNSNEEIEASELIADSILKNDPYYRSVFANSINYWIIDNRMDTAYGPLTEPQFIKLRKSLRVPHSLQLSSFKKSD